jgi:hypothetical protein
VKAAAVRSSILLLKDDADVPNLLVAELLARVAAKLRHAAPHARPMPRRLGAAA